MNSSWYSNLVPVLTPFSNFFKYLVGLAMMLIISNQNQPSVGMIVAAVANAHTAMEIVQNYNGDCSDQALLTVHRGIYAGHECVHRN